MVRTLYNCQKVFLFGMTQYQESQNGIDELITNLPKGRHLAFQFKAPRPRPANQLPYRYSINDRQNSNLLRLANNRPDAVYYVFPHYNTVTKIHGDLPNLMEDTYCLRVYDLHDLPPSRNMQGTHKIETDPPIAVVHSEPLKMKLMDISVIFQNIFGKDSATLQDTLISHEHMKEWLNEIIIKTRWNKRVIGQRLRGFYTLCIS